MYKVSGVNGFGGLLNDIALKPIRDNLCPILRFGGLLNHIALKLAEGIALRGGGFGGLLNDIALKPQISDS